MTKIEQDILNVLDPLSPNAAKNYHDLMEGYRCRVDAEMMQYSFEEAKRLKDQQEKHAQELQKTGLGATTSSGLKGFNVAG